MPNPNSKYKIKFNVLLDEAHDKMLIELSQRADLSKSHLCRTLIKAAAGMRIGQQPACADGTACRCPHAHVYAPSLPRPVAPDPDTDAPG